VLVFAHLGSIHPVNPIPWNARRANRTLTVGSACVPCEIGGRRWCCGQEFRQLRGATRDHMSEDRGRAQLLCLYVHMYVQVRSVTCLGQARLGTDAAVDGGRPASGLLNKTDGPKESGPHEVGDREGVKVPDLRNMSGIPTK
jgi:hypothetical protein